MLACVNVAQAAPRLLVLGDSLSAAYGIPQAEGWVSLLQTRLIESGYDHQVVNLSIAGETTAGGLRRLAPALRDYTPDLVLLQLGANDGLRALALDQMRSNLAQMIAQAQGSGARVLLFEMRIPPNYGLRYAQSFQQSFGQVSEAAGAVLLPFFLAPIALDPGAFQADGIHPTAAAQRRLLDAVWPTLETLLRPAQPAARAALSR